MDSGSLYYVSQWQGLPAEMANATLQTLNKMQGQFIEEMCSPQPQAESAAKRIDKAIILKALG